MPVLTSPHSSSTGTCPKVIFHAPWKGREQIYSDFFTQDWLPCFSAEDLHTRYPDGLEFWAADEPELMVELHDIVIVFEPHVEQRDAIVKLLELVQPENRILLSIRENPVAYYHRKWRFESEFLSHFHMVFSSAGLFADNKIFFWVPSWNFLQQAENNQSNSNLLNIKAKPTNFLAINPLNSGAQVSSERVDIISYFVNAASDHHVFGAAELYESEPFAKWAANWRGEIPFGEGVNRYIHKIRSFERYRFVLVIENVFSDGYITEKLGEPLAALNIPIYFGPPNIEFYLPELFKGGVINGHDFGSLDQLLQFIRSFSDHDYEDRVSRILKFRSEYLELTSRFNIWRFIFNKVFSVPLPESAAGIAAKNKKLAKWNRSEFRQARRQELEHLIQGGLQGHGYGVEARKILWDVGDP